MTTCPSCGSNRVHRSRTRNFAERLRRQFSFRRPYRCDACGWRGWSADTTHASAAEFGQTHVVESVDLDEIDRTLEGAAPESGARNAAPHR